MDLEVHLGGVQGGLELGLVRGLGGGLGGQAGLDPLLGLGRGDEHEVDVLEDALHRVALDVARGDEQGLALEAHLEHEAGVAQREGEVVVGQRHVLRLAAAAVDDRGHATLATGAARGALAEVRAGFRGDADLSHNYSYVVRAAARVRGRDGGARPVAMQLTTGTDGVPRLAAGRSAPRQ